MPHPAPRVELPRHALHRAPTAPAPARPNTSERIVEHPHRIGMRGANEGKPVLAGKLDCEVGGYRLGHEDGNPCAYRFRRHIHGSSPACEYGCPLEIDALDQRSAYRLVEGVVPTQIFAAEKHSIPKRGRHNSYAHRASQSEARAAREAARGIIGSAIDLGRTKVARDLSTTTLDALRFRTLRAASIADRDRTIEHNQTGQSTKQRKGHTSC